MLCKAYFGKVDPKAFGVNMEEFYINYFVFHQGPGVRSLSQAGATVVSLFTTNSGKAGSGVGHEKA